MTSTKGKGYVKLNIDPTSSGTFIQDVFQQQQSVISEQDEGLEKIGDSLRTLKGMSHQIGNELEEQSEILDELGGSMSSTEARMNNVMKKLAKLTHLEDESRQCTAILVLIGLIVILLFILVIF